MINSDISVLFTQESMWMILKFGYMIAFALYALFAFVVSAQVKQMTKTIDGGINKLIILISRVHLIVSIALFVLALIVL